FVNRHRAALIQRVSQVKPLADALLSQGLIQEETYTNICAAATRQDRMRELYAALHCTGDQAKAAFYTILKDAEPYLVEDLGKSPSACLSLCHLLSTLDLGLCVLHHAKPHLGLVLQYENCSGIFS
ncbi:ASC protein, partial [Amia calva]|nr:ASC protein [Amia calva]